MELREPGPRSKQIVEQERRHMAPGLQSFAQYAGVAMARGSGWTPVAAWTDPKGYFSVQALKQRG